MREGASGSRASSHRKTQPEAMDYGPPRADVTAAPVLEDPWIIVDLPDLDRDDGRRKKIEAKRMIDDVTFIALRPESRSNRPGL